MKKGTYREAAPGETIPGDYVSIPIFWDHEDFFRDQERRRAEAAKDVTPREE